MYKVIFENSRKQEREIGTAVDIEGTYAVIDKFLDEHNYTSYYKRVWEENGRTKVDVGSWSEFFYIQKYEEVIIKCEHLECPYKDCSYHQNSTGIYDNCLAFGIEQLPVWHPINDDDMKSCFSYMDI